MARSNNLKVFGVSAIDDLTGEQYNVLVESEILRADMQEKALKEAKARSSKGGQRKGQMFSIKTKD